MKAHCLFLALFLFAAILATGRSYPCHSIRGYCTTRRCRKGYFYNPADDVNSHPDCSYSQHCCQPYDVSYSGGR